MAGQYHQLNGHEFEQTLGESEGQRSHQCCIPLGERVAESDMTEHQGLVMLGTFPVLTCKPYIFSGEVSVHNFCPFCSRVVFLILRFERSLYVPENSSFFLFFKKLIYFNWRLITLHYCSDFCHTLT